MVGLQVLGHCTTPRSTRRSRQHLIKTLVVHMPAFASTARWWAVRVCVCRAASRQHNGCVMFFLTPRSGQARRNRQHSRPACLICIQRAPFPTAGLALLASMTHTRDVPGLLQGASALVWLRCLRRVDVVCKVCMGTGTGLSLTHAAALWAPLLLQAVRVPGPPLVGLALWPVCTGLARHADRSSHSPASAWL
jgi:hypothetical protein